MSIERLWQSSREDAQDALTMLCAILLCSGVYWILA